MARFEQVLLILKALAQKRQKAQSFVELALVLPILLIMLLGVVEVSLFIGRYLDILDLTREASRFASVRDPFEMAGGGLSCSVAEPFNFYFHTSCIFSPPAGSALCTDPGFCNGLNSYVVLNPATDDVVITVFTIAGNTVTDQWPTPFGYWALSDHDPDAAHNDNWKKDCQGNIVAANPYFTAARVNSNLQINSPPNKGFVGIELYYCYHQALALPFLTQFVPDPLRIHAYTIMPLPAAQPSPTPIPT